MNGFEKISAYVDTIKAHFDLISTHNGWAIAAVGIVIVFSGLVMLSFFISQLHKILAYWEKPDKFDFLKLKKKRADKKKYSISFLTKNQRQTAKQFRLLADTMDEHFALPKLIRLAEVSGVDRPYYNLNTLLDAGIIEPDSEGFFTWNTDRFKRIAS